jgi:tetratricopeptide (TPR) repeat protein
LIVGNVRGGAHFRGDIPYQSTTSFQGSVPSADTISSFLRYSAGQEDFSRGTGLSSRTLPYYNPSQTVTFTMPGRSGVLTPANASASLSVDSRAEGKLAQKAQSSRRVLAGATTSFSELRQRPMTMSMQEMERLISAEVALPGQEVVEEVAKPRAGRISDRAADLRIRPVGQDDSLQRTIKGELSEEIRQRLELARRPYAEETAAMEEKGITQFGREQILAREQVESEGIGKPGLVTNVPIGDTPAVTGLGDEQQELFETYKDVERQIENLQKDIERLRAAEKGAGGAPFVKGVSEAKETIGTEIEAKSGLLDIRHPGTDTQLQSFRKNIERLASRTEQALRAPDTSASLSTGRLSAGRVFAQESLRAGQIKEFFVDDLSAEADRTLGGKSFATFSEDKYNEYIAAAKVYQKQGKHYRAASAYTLASIYKPDEPLAYIGRSHALFAAGEYMSSALYLTRALEISPEYAKVKVDLLAILGTDDQEKLDSRIAEIEQWYKRSDEADLQFLLGYVYYQAGELDKAKEVIDAAYIKMPESIAVDAVRKTIDEAIMRQTQY